MMLTRWPRLWAVFCDGSVVGVRSTKTAASKICRLFQRHAPSVMGYRVVGPYVLKDGGR